MNKFYKYFFVLFLGLLTSCNTGDNSQIITDDMSDSVKLENLDLHLEKHPDDMQAHYLRAQVLFRMGRNKEALADIDKALRSDPDNIDFLLLNADICLKNGNMADCYKVLQHAEEVAPDNLEVLLKMGEITFDSKDYDRSIEYLTKVTAKDENNRTALFMKGYIYKEKGDTATAVQFFRKVCDKYPDYALAFEELGVLYASREEPMALEYLNTAAKLDPSNTNTLYALAMFYQNREDYENAETLYHQILDLNENSADAWHNLGWIELTHYHDYERAVEYFDKALVINPQMENAAANRELAVGQLKDKS